MPRTLLLCFIHGFKGTDNTFQSFPDDLKRQVAAKLPEDNVDSVVYPKYETKGELAQSTERLLAWLKERVAEARKNHPDASDSSKDRDVGVILVAHSMGGFVAADTLFLILNERHAAGQDDTPMSPLIQGLLTFDTPYNGLARSMFVYGAFSNYQTVSSVFNVMTALTAAAPQALSSHATALKRSMGATTSSAAAPRTATKSAAAWQGWQLIAVRTGTVGAIAAGGVAAYMHRQQIMQGLATVRSNLSSEAMRENYQSGVDALGQGLAYINRGNVGKSFAYLSDHLTFVGALMKQQELGRRLERLAALRGVGVHDFYTSLGENGVWSGGYFVPERTFCAVPGAEQGSHGMFSRQVVEECKDEVEAHMGMFKRERNKGYDAMTAQASEMVVRWFGDDGAQLYDDPKFREPAPPEPVEEPVATTEDGEQVPKTEAVPAEAKAQSSGEDAAAEMPDESPLDIAAAASMVPLPDDEDNGTPDSAKDAEKRTYMRYLFGVAQQAGTGLRGYVPRTMPDMPQMPSGSSFKSLIPTQMPSLPSVNVFGAKKKEEGAAAGRAGQGEGKEKEEEKKGDEVVHAREEEGEKMESEKPAVAAEVKQES